MGNRTGSAGRRRVGVAALLAVVAGAGLAGPASARIEPASNGKGPIRFADDVVPNDPFWASRTWGSTTLAVPEASYLQAIRLPAAWATTTGDDNLTVAVLDSGVLSSHPDLAGRLDMANARDFVNGDNVPEDDCAHGTMVAGIIAASTNTSPSRGIAGATWKGKILPLKVMHHVGTSCQTEGDDGIADAINYAVDKRVAVINLSLGGIDPPNVKLQQALNRAVAAGVVIVAAAGNEGSSAPHFPAASPGVVAVGSTDSNENRSSFSNFGSWVDIMAPGENISGTWNDGGYRSGDGTSYSSPLVAGVVLLMRAANPNGDGATIVQRLLATRRTVAAGGMVDAGAAVAAAASTSFSSASANGSGYWTLGQQGQVYPFGGARWLGNAPLSGGATAVDIESTPSGGGYWVVDNAGHVFGFGDAATRYFGNADALLPGEQVTSLSATLYGNGYWIFTSKGRVFNRGDAPALGDLAALKLNGPILDSTPTPTGQGYYMVGSDGGIFAFGDARFAGSMGGQHLNGPVQSLVPNRNGSGYWLVASDGGVFAFGDAEFRGSMGGIKLNAPVTGMVPFGNGYVMVASDGGVFSFSDQPFSGSLVGSGVTQPIIAIATKAATS